MKVQSCADGVELLRLGRDPQGDMLKRCREFQRRVGTWDDRIHGFGRNAFALPMAALHHLDMGVQECSEAGDMIEGGWKGHKTEPRAMDADELLMELVDVAHFVFNAYLYMGGDHEDELVAAHANKSDERIKLIRLGLQSGWQMGERSWDRNGGALRRLFHYGHLSHGGDGEAEIACRINHLRHQICGAAATIRTGLETVGRPEMLPVAPGFIYIEIVPWLYACAASIHGVDQQRFYSAFCWKNDINFRRQDEGY